MQLYLTLTSNLLGVSTTKQECQKSCYNPHLQYSVRSLRSGPVQECEWTAEKTIIIPTVAISPAALALQLKQKQITRLAR